ncbi:MAG: hypothetical protein NC832_01830 [Candidatus Omnitrophica bacterium]|nr:hypothetical protein [Candidatus Omnitrophota bacterium]
MSKDVKEVKLRRVKLLGGIGMIVLLLGTILSWLVRGWEALQSGKEGIQILPESLFIGFL